MSKNLAKWERSVSVGAGAALFFLAARRAQGRMSLAAAGAGLLARGVSGYCPVSAALGRHEITDTRDDLAGAKGTHIRESIVINRPPAEIYAIWRDLAGLPRFMRHLERVEVMPGDLSRWVVKGPAGTLIEWDAQIINDIPHSLIAWQSIPGARVSSAGSVRFFRTTTGGTDVRVHLQYSPPADHVGAWVAAFFGSDPSRQIREDLQNLKRALETGERPSLPRVEEAGHGQLSLPRVY
jgi:uncharacterized membrane protein